MMRELKDTESAITIIVDKMEKGCLYNIQTRGQQLTRVEMIGILETVKNACLNEGSITHNEAKAD